MSFQRGLPKDAFATKATHLRLPHEGQWEAVSASAASAVIDAHPGGAWEGNRYVHDGRVILLADHPNFPPHYLSRTTL